MKKFLRSFFLSLFRATFWLRYRIRVKGLDKMNPSVLSKPGGVIFLPNHPTVFIDPVMVGSEIWKRYNLRPIVIDYMYYQPIVYSFMRLANAIPIPNFSKTSNSLKIKKGEKVIEEVCEGLRQGENFMIYPAGGLKSTGYEQVAGTSAAHRVIQEVPEANVVLVRTTGLWGSSFSRAATGKTPSITQTVWRGVKKTLKNLLFFTPRREVTIEFVPAPQDFPYQSSRREMNAYIEKWFNAPFEAPVGEPLKLVSYSMWGEDLLQIEFHEEVVTERVDMSKVPEEVQKKVREKVALLAEQDESAIEPKQTLTRDLGLDSIDIAELSAFLKDEFDIEGVPTQELTTVQRVMGIATHQVEIEEEEIPEIKGLSKWHAEVHKERVARGEGETIIESFLNKALEHPNRMSASDLRAGVLTYGQLRMRAILIAEYIRTLPGEYIGIMLPASVAAYVTVLAAQLAGKIPLMVNWTIGPRHLDHVKELSGVQVVLSSWAFIDRLENVDFASIEDDLVMLEDVARDFSLSDKLRALYRGRRSTKSVLRHFGVEKKDHTSTAVLLFTSGTESAPKGVPLTHRNIMANHRSALAKLPIYGDDVLLGILPPFHSFGFAITGILPLLWGIRIAYSPDPTNGKEVSRAVERWKTTIVCGAPTFLKAMFKVAQPSQLKSARIIVTGAEKAPPELFHMMEQVGKKGHLLEGYGITECSPALTMNQMGEPLPGVGPALPGVEICIVDLEKKGPLPLGEQGLILVRGENVFSGYLNKGLKSPFLDVAGKQWYNTGDLGYIDPKTESLVLSGRLKRFIKIGGEMVSLASVETALGEEAVEEGWPIDPEGPSIAVIAHEKAGEKPLLHVVAKFSLTPDTVNAALRKRGISNLVKVSQVHSVEEIPIMGTGKIHYRKLENQFFGGD